MQARKRSQATMLKWKDANLKDERRFERLACNLYRRNDLIYCRVWVDGRRTFRCTGTDDPATARRILKEWQNQRVLEEHGIETRAMVLERNRLRTYPKTSTDLICWDA